MMFTVYLILGVVFWTSPLAIMAFQPEIRRQTNLWRVLALPYRWNLLGVLQFIMLLMLEAVGFSFIMQLIILTR